MTKVRVRVRFQLSVVSVWLVGGLLNDCWRIGLTAVGICPPSKSPSGERSAASRRASLVFFRRVEPGHPEEEVMSGLLTRLLSCSSEEQVFPLGVSSLLQLN